LSRHPDPDRPQESVLPSYPIDVLKLLQTPKRTRAEASVSKLAPPQLELTRRRIERMDPLIAPAFKRLQREAEEAMQAEPFTVVDKTMMPPSGDPHDYMSLNPYWWPNPKTASGEPYVRREGQVNPEYELMDKPRLHAFVQTFGTLTLGYALTQWEDYAKQAVKLLRTWFVDPETRMNPNLTYGQCVPGVCPGRGIGIVETMVLASNLLPGIGMLAGSKALKPEDEYELQSWFKAYLVWLVGSKYGKSEAQHHNNHSLSFDLQVITYALYIGRVDVARHVLQGVPTRRIAHQIEDDGRMLRELGRSKSMQFTAVALGLMMRLADLGRQMNVDIWGYRSAKGRSIRRALNWLIPRWLGKEPWPYEQADHYDHERSMVLLRRAAGAYAEPKYEALIKRLPNLPEEVRKTHRVNLLDPPSSTLSTEAKQLL
jgi:hypothetical protein